MQRNPPCTNECKYKQKSVGIPAVFQALINDILPDVLKLFMFVCLDDMLVFSLHGRTAGRFGPTEIARE